MGKYVNVEVIKENPIIVVALPKPIINKQTLKFGPKKTDRESEEPVSPVHGGNCLSDQITKEWIITRNPERVEVG